MLQQMQGPYLSLVSFSPNSVASSLQLNILPCFILSNCFFDLHTPKCFIPFYFRLVGQLRHRTLDAIEEIGAWHRRTDSSEPFMYANVGNYLAYIGTDLVRDCRPVEGWLQW